jgi:micrococcal nuclease
MKIVHQFSLLCVLVLVYTSPVLSQSVKPIVDPCGDPRVESFSCPLLRGKVVKVLDGDTLILDLANRRRLRVHLAGIAAPAPREEFGRASRLLLGSLVSGRAVEVCVNTSQYLLLRRSRVKESAGVVHIRSMGLLDVNLLMIQAGLARHAKAQPYSMSNHAECHYVRAEEEARAAGRGLWYAQHNNGIHPTPHKRASHVR